MFQLIVAVISIALVAALAIASIYYGGEAFTKSSLRAQVTTLVNGGQQIAGAVSLYSTDYPGNLASGQATTILPASYLSAEPGHTPFNTTTAKWMIDLSVPTNKVAKIDIKGTSEICLEVSRQAGTLKADGTAGTGGQFQCSDVTGAATNAFNFKL